jgi:hypothetical protein
MGLTLQLLPFVRPNFWASGISKSTSMKGNLLSSKCAHPASYTFGRDIFSSDTFTASEMQRTTASIGIWTLTMSANLFSQK